MSVGETLASARRRAGLSVAQISERTRIRAATISSIEDGDYSTCGGDFYARGHIRAIAKAVGVDAEPLIAEYDSLHRAPSAVTAVSLEELLATSARTPPRRLVGWRWAAAAGLALVIVLGFGVYRLLSGSPQPAGRAVAAQPVPPQQYLGPSPAARSSHAAVLPAPAPAGPALVLIGHPRRIVRPVRPACALMTTSDHCAAGRRTAPGTGARSGKARHRHAHGHHHRRARGHRHRHAHWHRHGHAHGDRHRHAPGHRGRATRITPGERPRR